MNLQQPQFKPGLNIAVMKIVADTSVKLSSQYNTLRVLMACQTDHHETAYIVITWSHRLEWLLDTKGCHSVVTEAPRLNYYRYMVDSMLRNEKRTFSFSHPGLNGLSVATSP